MAALVGAEIISLFGEENEGAEEEKGALIEEARRLLEGFASELCSLRSEAISARISSGIENIWQYCDDAFNGEDEVTKGRKGPNYKPMTIDGPFISREEKRGWNRSTAFYNITAPYVLLAAKRPHEILFPTEMRNWELRRTPKTNLDLLQEWLKSHATSTQDLPIISGIIAGLSLEREEQISEAQRQIDDWMKEGPEPFVDLAEQILEDSARMGTGVLKGPIPLLSRSGEMQPGIIRISAWDLYPSPSCGEEIQNGDFLFEREEISERLLRKKMKEEGAELGWLEDQMEAVLQEGPRTFSKGPPLSAKTFELWHFQGEVPIKALALCGCDLGSFEKEKVWANVTLCNDRVIRVGQAPLQQRFTYYALPWRRRKGYWAGVGVAEDLEDIQRGLNAQIRNLQDNSALSAVPQLIYTKGLLEPVNSSYTLEPGKEWNVNVDEGDPLFQFIKNAIFTIEIPCRLDELRKNVDLFLSMAEQVTGIGGVVRGLTQPDSVGGGQLQMNAAGQSSRRIARLWDSFLLRPLIQAFVQWILDFGTLPLADVTVAVYGSTVLVERDLQAQAVMTAVQLSANPIYGQDPEMMMEQWLLANKFDPAKTRMGEARKAEVEALIQAQMQQPGMAPQVQSAQIRAQALTTQSQIEAQSDMARTTGQLEDSARKRAHDTEMKILDAKLELMRYAAQKNIDLRTAQAEMENIHLPHEMLSRELDTSAEIEKERAKAPPPKKK